MNSKIPQRKQCFLSRTTRLRYQDSSNQNIVKKVGGVYFNRVDLDLVFFYKQTFNKIYPADITSQTQSTFSINIKVKSNKNGFVVF